MFTIGQELYRLTPRDLETLVIDPFFRSATASGPTAGPAFFFDLPRDRCLYIDRVTVQGLAGAAENWQRFDLGVGFPLLTATHPLISLRTNGSLVSERNSVSDTTLYFTDTLKLLLPPGASRIEFSGVKSGALAGSLTVNLTGYLLPPGGIGRA